MENFDYHNPTRILFGKGRLHELNNQIPQDARVMILHGINSAQSSGLLDQVRKALGNRTTHTFGGIEPNPNYETLAKATNEVKKTNTNYLLAVGGGSVMDATKFIALAALAEDQNPLELLQTYKLHQLQQALPLGTIVTLPATGSEMNKSGVITHNGLKYHFRNPNVYPRFSILDPTLTTNLPPDQIANGIIDTYVHTLEVYATLPSESRFQDRAAEGLLQTLIEIGPKTLKDPQDYDARANLMWCATMALCGLLGAGVPQDWSAHMIGHQLTTLYGIPHGRTLAILIPAIWTVLWREKKEKLLQYATRVWNIGYGEDRIRIELAIDKTRQYFENLGAATRLRDYGLDETTINPILEALGKQGMTQLGETGKVTPDVVRKILEAAL